MTDFDQLPVHPGSVPDGPVMTVTGLLGLQEFVPYVQKHSGARKGYVVGMRRKSKRDELDEMETYLHSESVRTAFSALAESHAELLNALKLMVDRFGAGTGEKLFSQCYAIDNASKAIARAERVGGE